MTMTENDLLKKVMQKKTRPGLAGGGLAKRQGQGLIRGPGTGTSDSVPVDLPSGAKIAASNNEFIMPADTTAKVGAHNLQAIVDATHTPVPEKGRFGRANGGSALYNQLSENLTRGRGTGAGALFGSGAATGADISTANPSPQIQQGGLASRPFGSLVSGGAEDTSLALGRTAVAGITPVSQYGGMDATAGKRIINAGPSVEVPTTFGYANGGRVRMADGGRLPYEDIDYSKVPSPGAEPYPSAQGYSVEELPTENINIKAPRQMTPTETRLYNNPSLGDPLIQKRIAQANANFNVGNAAEAVKNTASDAIEAAKTKGGAALDWVKGKLGGAGDAAQSGGSRLLRALPLVGAGLEAANVAERSAQPGASQNEEIGKGVGRFGAGVIAANTAGAAIPPMPGAFAAVRPLGMLAAGAAGYLGADKYFGRPEVPNTGSAQTPMDPKSDVPSVSNELRNFKNVERVPSTKFGELSTANLGQSAQNQEPAFAGNNDLRRAVVQANRPDTDLHDLGDYGAPGTKIFGRASEPGGKINDFSGVGGGHPVPNNGIDFGLRPEDIAAYKAGAAGSGAGAQFGMRAPEYYSSPEAGHLNTLAAQMAERHAAMKPGDPGRKRLAAQLASVNETASRLQSADQAVNSHNMSAFGHAAGLQQHMLTMNNNLAVAQGRIGIERAQMGANWQIKQQEMANQMKEFAHQHGKDAISRNEKLIDDYVGSQFPEDKAKQAQYGGMLKVMAGAKSFDRDGKKLSLHELDAHDLSKTLGSITQQTAIALQQGANEHPMNIETGQATRPATFAESLWQGARNGTPFGSAYRHFRYGDVAADDGETVTPNFELGTAPYYRQQ